MTATGRKETVGPVDDIDLPVRAKIKTVLFEAIKKPAFSVTDEVKALPVQKIDFSVERRETGEQFEQSDVLVRHALLACGLANRKGSAARSALVTRRTMPVRAVAVITSAVTLQT